MNALKTSVVFRCSRTCGIVESVGLLYQHFGYGLLGVSVVEQPGELHQFDPDLVISNQVIAI